MTLTERLNKERRQTDVTPIAERRKVPVWIERMQRQGLTPTDHTSSVKVA
jgi:hypothetical protein